MRLIYECGLYTTVYNTKLKEEWKVTFSKLVSTKYMYAGRQILAKFEGNDNVQKKVTRDSTYIICGQNGQI